MRNFKIIAQTSPRTQFASALYSASAPLFFLAMGNPESSASANQNAKLHRSFSTPSIVYAATMENRTHYPDLNGPKPFNRDYKNSLRVSMQLNIWILKAIGAWPKSPDHSWMEILYCRTLHVSCYGLLGLVLIPSSMYIVLEIKDFYNQLKLGSALSFFMMCLMKYCVLIVREADIRECVEYIKNDWRNVQHMEDRKIMLENANFGRRIVVICSFFMYGSLLFYYVALPLTRAKIIDENGNLTYRQLIFPVPKIIVDARRSPINEIFYFIQLLSGLVAHNITVAACSLAVVLPMHACGQLQVLVSWINHLVDGRENDNDTVDERLASVIQLHVRILK